MSSKAIIIKGIDASASPFGKINFVVEPQDLTSRVKWMGLIGGQAKCRLFTLTRNITGVDKLLEYKADIPISFISYGGSVGFLDVTEFQGATLELNSFPYTTGDNAYFHICFANALSDNGITPIVDEGLDIIPMSAKNHDNAVHTIAIYRDSKSSTVERRTVQLTVPTVSSGNVYFVFTQVSNETEFSGYVKIV